MKFVLILLLSQLVRADDIPVLKRQEWLLHFSTTYANLFCEKIRKDNKASRWPASTCLSTVEQWVYQCEKKWELPSAVIPGRLAEEAGRKIGYCVSKNFERMFNKK